MTTNEIHFCAQQAQAFVAAKRTPRQEVTHAPRCAVRPVRHRSSTISLLSPSHTTPASLACSRARALTDVCSRFAKWRTVSFTAHKDVRGSPFLQHSQMSQFLLYSSLPFCIRASFANGKLAHFVHYDLLE